MVDYFFGIPGWVKDKMTAVYKSFGRESANKLCKVYISAGICETAFPSTPIN